MGLAPDPLLRHLQSMDEQTRVYRLHEHSCEVSKTILEYHRYSETPYSEVRVGYIYIYKYFINSEETTLELLENYEVIFLGYC